MGAARFGFVFLDKDFILEAAGFGKVSGFSLIEGEKDEGYR